MPAASAHAKRCLNSPSPSEQAIARRGAWLVERLQPELGTIELNRNVPGERGSGPPERDPCIGKKSAQARLREELDALKGIEFDVIGAWLLRMEGCRQVADGRAAPVRSNVVDHEVASSGDRSDAQIRSQSDADPRTQGHCLRADDRNTLHRPSDRGPASPDDVVMVPWFPPRNVACPGVPTVSTLAAASKHTQP